jgi:TrmH family RNA methyltransferase
LTVSKAELKKIKALNTKKGRKDQSRFVVSGVRLLEEAEKAKFAPLLVFYTIQHSTRIKELVIRFKKSGVRTEEISDKNLNSISDTKSPQGIIAVFANPDSQLSKLYKPSFRRVLLCDKINDPGNLGTLARSALAFEFDMILITDKTAEIYNPKVIRASAGALFSIPAIKVSTGELTEFKKRTNAKILASVTNADKSHLKMPDSIDQRKLTNTMILAVGSEADGLSEDVLNIADLKITIPHSSKAESLNAAAAGSILMHNIFQREHQ